MSNQSAATEGNKANRKEMKGVYETIMANEGLTSSRYSHREALHRQVPVKDPAEYSLDQITRKSLPYFLPWTPTAGPGQMPPDFSWMSDNCAGKATIGVIGGGVMGLLMGVFLGALSDTAPPVQVIAGKEVPQAPFREQLKVAMRATSEKALYWCRNFAFITGVFAGSECLVEKVRLPPIHTCL